MNLSTFIINFIIVSFISNTYGADLTSCKLDAIYQFGDSLSDTGNSIVEVPQAYHARLPYGETIGKATGRPSDGLLMIDYTAQSAGLPLLEPYENPNSTFSHGADFSVAGVTALSKETLMKLNLSLGFSNTSLEVQIESMKKLLSTICNNARDCQEKLKSSLFIVGIGGNDYGRAFQRGDSVYEVNKTIVPLVVAAIEDSIQKIINFGARRIIVTGSYPIGCSPAYLTMFSNTSTTKDSFGCLKDYNDIFFNHGVGLKIAVEKATKANPNVTIVFSDLYNALLSVIKDRSTLGLTSYQNACCGTGGKYNVTLGQLDKMCGAKDIPVCPNPKEYLFWDEWHFTHQANKALFDFLLTEMLPKLQCTS
ncbi:GDSL esterase/lipase At1g28650-like [Mercurialis annua]|uniref:GDSL esterase/lipase At1g28650-like n=1 Tax=Mercurialis annua TaxID=3986 RepID=UPI00215E547A|nr:GDSL esterase/lipase At1g28650-like [Mercurialis annua]